MIARIGAALLLLLLGAAIGAYCADRSANGHRMPRHYELSVG